MCIRDRVGEGRDDGDDGEGEPQAGQGVAGGVGQAADVHPVHHAVQHVDELGHGHGQGQAQDIPRHTALGEVHGSARGGLAARVKNGGHDAPSSQKQGAIPPKNLTL